MKNCMIIVFSVCVGIYFLAVTLITLSYVSERDTKIDHRTVFNLLKPKVPDISLFTPYKNVSDYDTYMNWSTNKTFRIDETYLMNKLEDQLSCLPVIWGHSTEEGEKIFPYFQYPECKKFNNFSNEEVYYDSKIKSIEINCDNQSHNKSEAIYVTGPTYKADFYSSKRNKFRVKNYKGSPVSVKPSTEWIIARCKYENITSNLLMGDMHPSFQVSSYLSSISESKNDRYERHTPILYLVLDSFSRRHFYRKLPKTVNFLQELSKEGTYGVFDFLLHNIIGKNSIENMSVVLSGMERSERRKSNSSHDMWVLLKKVGFMTMIGLEDCSKVFYHTFGISQSVDHSIQQFFCAAKRYSDFTTDKEKRSIQRCIGDKMSHDYMLDYLSEYLDIYRYSNRWAYLHIDAAHEGSGQHAATLDDSLVEFLEKSISRGDLPIIFIEADHGMRYGDWQRNEAGAQEWKLPTFWMGIPHRVLKDIPNSYTNLMHNTHRFTTKYDVRETMLSLAYFLKNTPREKESIGIDLINQQVPDNRTCQDMQILPEYCSCLNFLEIGPEVLYNQFLADKELKNIRDLVFNLADLTINIVNQDIKDSNSKVPLCKQLKLLEISNAAISVFNDIIHTRVVIVTSPYMVVESLFKLLDYSTDDTYYETYFRQTKMKSQLIYITQISQYDNMCETVSQMLDIPAEFCICEEEVLKNHYKKYNKNDIDN